MQTETIFRMEDLPENQSIFELLKNLQSSEDQEQGIFSEWKTLLGKLCFTVDARCKSDEWFEKCFEYCEGERKLYEAKKYTFEGVMREEDKKLHEELVKHLSLEIGAEPERIVKWNLSTVREQVVQSESPEVWIKRAHQCVKEERRLVQQYTKEKHTVKESCEHLYYKLDKKIRTLKLKLNELDAEVRKFKESKDIFQNLAERIETVESVVNAQGGMRNGVQSLFQKGSVLEQDARQTVEENALSFLKTVQDLQPIFEELYADSKSLIERLIEELRQWQHEFKLKYAELYADVDLNRFAPWCSKTGELLQNILCTDIPCLENAINDVVGSGSQQCAPMYSQFEELLSLFYQRTFVVTEQNDWNVKTSVTRPLLITVRILAADNCNSFQGVRIQAIFVQEQHIDKCYQKDTGFLDINKLREKGLKFKSGQSAKFVRHINKMEGRFSSIELCTNLTRAKSLPVFEEKYRLIFYAQLGTETYWKQCDLEVSKPEIR